MKKIKVLFVCLGNICRSPLAEAVCRDRLAKYDIDWVEVDSAGTGDWHLGQPPHDLAQAAGKNLGYDLSTLRARQVTQADFQTFDHIIAMDRSNIAELAKVNQAQVGPAPRLLLESIEMLSSEEVPDPYGRGIGEFVDVVELIELGIDNLMNHLL